MNPRLQELAEQSTKKLHGFSYRFGNTTETIFDHEQFAELIVRECAELTRWKDFDMSVEQRIRLSVYQDIKEHFGVEP